ncbi:hypothetical protein NP233_g9447 [Leucocoprinus birnbaumii]|uniref:Uncharacterized protein n=1 Tax=Leucocoprinus birnbaumii TaxID=56174 RepID=A0AAD5YM78_9AGAR|nr:hypothetical protein NP233_g9447 [Leucocoprinus birnbaumii]
MTNKKRKISGLSGIELEQALHSLKQFRKTIGDTEAGADEPGAVFLDDLDDMIARMEIKFTQPQAFNFSVSEETLAKLGLKESSNLILKSNHSELAEQSRLIAENDAWSSTQLYGHLELLQRLVPKDNEAATRFWIDAFFFRVAAMVPAGHRMVLNVEQRIPPTIIHPSTQTTLTEYPDYTAIVAEDFAAGSYFIRPLIATAKRLNTGFFVKEAKSGPLSHFIPQAVYELYASGKRYE